jgi:hypothetical protein
MKNFSLVKVFGLAANLLTHRRGLSVIESARPYKLMGRCRGVLTSNELFEREGKLNTYWVNNLLEMFDGKK